jgi:hypothetical protein
VFVFRWDSFGERTGPTPEPDRAQPQEEAANKRERAAPVVEHRERR